MKEITATVVKNTGSHYLLAMLPQWLLFPAVLKGRIRLEGSTATNPVAVGDRVRVVVGDDFTPENPGDTAVIKEVLPRDNYIIRRPSNLSRQSHIIAANLDSAMIVVTLAFPQVKLPFLDRLLVTCEVYGVPATIVLNKMDIFSSHDEFQDEIRAFRHIYNETAGYDIIEASARTGQGIDILRERLTGKTTLLSGVSGVGKSSLIKAIDPSLNPRVGEISMAHLQGTHTTTFYEMYRVASGGYIIDTPGIRGFGLVNLEKEEIPLYFPEMLAAAGGCRFTPCTHTHEPGCAVKRGLEDGTITPERYNSYLGMLDEDTKYRTSE